MVGPILGRVRERSREGLAALAAALMVLAWLAPAPASGDSTLADHFREVGFQRDVRDEGPAPHIVKWDGKIRMQVLGDFTADDFDHLVTVVRAVQGSKAPSISLGNRRSFPNLFVLMTPNLITGINANLDLLEIVTGDIKETYGLVASYASSKPHGCLPLTRSGTYVEESDYISFAVLFVATENGQQAARTCLARGFLRVLGLPGPATQPGSVMNEQETEVIFPSRLDFDALDLLYAPEIEAGMLEAEAMAIVEKLSKGD